MNGKGSSTRPRSRYCTAEEYRERMDMVFPSKAPNPYGERSIVLDSEGAKKYFKDMRKPCRKCKIVKTCNRERRRKCGEWIKWDSSK